MAEEGPPLPFSLWTQAYRTWLDAWAAGMGVGGAAETPAGSAQADPVQLTRRAFDSWLNGWNLAFEQLLNAPETLTASGRTLDALLNVQLPLREQTTAMMALWLQTLNLPSRDELLRVAVQINEANARLDELRDLVEDLSDHVAALGAREGRRTPAPVNGDAR